MLTKTKELPSFTFETDVMRAEESDNKLFLIGCASSTAEDTFETIFSEECQRGFVEDCENDTVIVESIHSEKLAKIGIGSRYLFSVGRVVESYLEYDDKEQKTKFIVKIEIDSENPEAVRLYNMVKNPKKEYGHPEKLALSIHGKIIKWHYEKGKKIFDRVRLTHIAIVDNPSNKDTYLEVISRSIEIYEKEVSREMVTPTISPQEIRNQIDSALQEMVDQITAVTESNINFKNSLSVIRNFVQKYSSIISAITCESEWCEHEKEDDDDEIEDKNETVSEASCKEDSASRENTSQNSFIEKMLMQIDSKTKEVDEMAKRIESTEVEQNNKEISRENENDRECEQRETSNTSNSEGRSDQAGTVARQQESEVEQNQPINKQEGDVMENTTKPENQVETPEVNDTVSREELVSVATNIETKFETISRESLEKIDSMTKLIETLAEKFETVSRELEALKNEPASTPADLSTVSREVEDAKTRFKNGKMTSKERNEFINNYMSIWTGVKK